MDHNKLINDLLEEMEVVCNQKVTASTPLLDEAQLDSFGIMMIITFLEDTYSIEVADDLLATHNFVSVTVIAQWALPLIKAQVC
ncbi:MAG: acyl carrier protein [Pseudomonadales bacterium]